MGIVMTPAKTPVRSPSNEELRQILGLLGYQVCVDDHHVQEAGGDDVMRLALLHTVSVMVAVHGQAGAPYSGATLEKIAEVMHNMNVGVGFEQCDDPHHASMRAGRGCCRLITEI